MNQLIFFRELHSLSNHKVAFIIISLLILAWFCVPAEAQENAHYELWNTYSTRHFVSKYRFWLRNDFGINHSFDEESSTEYLIRPRLIINLGNIVEFHPGIDFRFSHFPKSDNTFELRTWQGLLVHWPDIGRVMFDHFYRFEQRFFWIEGIPQEDFSLRSRFRLNTRLPINNYAITDNTFFVDFRGEIFLAHDNGVKEKFASTVRLGINLGFRQNAKWRYQLTGYIDGGKNAQSDNRTATRYIMEASVRTTF